MTDETENKSSPLGIVSFGSKEVVLTRARPEDMDVVEVGVSPDDPQNRVVELAKDEIKRTRWWLQDYWERKGLPVQQVELSDGVYQVTVYSWGRQLQEKQLATFAKVLGSFSAVKNGFVFDRFRYLLMDDNQPIYSKTGRLQNGVSRADLSTITLYPNAFQEAQSLLAPGISHLEWTLAHEGSHGLEEIPGEGMDRFIEQWKKVGGWFMLDKPKVLPGGATTMWETSMPQSCISDLARAGYDEDLAESGAAYIFIPTILDPVKRSFLEAEVPFDRTHQLHWQVESSSMEAILPIIPNGFKIKTVPRKAFVIKDIRMRTD